MRVQAFLMDDLELDVLVVEVGGIKAAPESGVRTAFYVGAQFASFIPIARSHSRTAAQSSCFFVAEMQKIVEAVGALDVAEDVTHVGARREKGVDGFNEFAFIGKGALSGFGAEAAPRSPRTDPRDVTAVFAFEVDCAQLLHLPTISVPCFSVKSTIQGSRRTRWSGVLRSGLHLTCHRDRGRFARGRTSLPKWLECRLSVRERCRVVHVFAGYKPGRRQLRIPA